MYIYINIYVYIWKHIYIYTHECICAHPSGVCCWRWYIYTHIYAYRHKYTYGYIYTYIHMYVYVLINWLHASSAMGWLRAVGSIKLQVSFAKEPYKRDDILQKRPIILSILLTVATPYRTIYTIKKCYRVWACVALSRKLARMHPGILSALWICV